MSFQMKLNNAEELRKLLTRKNFIPIPACFDAYAIYAGTIGKTHGDKKLRTPAENDMNNDSKKGELNRSISDIFVLFLSSIIQQL